jgi:Toprim-like
MDAVTSEWTCHAGCGSGNGTTLVARMFGIETGEAHARLLAGDPWRPVQVRAPYVRRTRRCSGSRREIRVQLAYAEELLRSGLSRAEAVQALMCLFGISRSTAYERLRVMGGRSGVSVRNGARRRVRSFAALKDLRLRDEQAPADTSLRSYGHPRFQDENFGRGRWRQVDVEVYGRALLDSEETLRGLFGLRGWTREALQRLGVGLDGERVTIPYRDATWRLVGLGRYQPDADKRGVLPKMLADAGSSRELFPPPETVDQDGWLWLVEGESDAIRAHSLGLAAVAVPGVQAWRSEWAQRFAGRRVVVCFDCDPPGRKAARRVAAALAPMSEDVRLLDLASNNTEGVDMSEYTAAAITTAERNQMRRMLLDAAEKAPRIDENGEPVRRELGVEPARDSR